MNMKTLNDYLKNAKKIAMDEFLHSVPNMTVGKFLELHDGEFNGKTVGDIDVPANIHIGFYIDLGDNKTRAMSELQVGSMKRFQHTIDGRNKECFYEELNHALKNVPDLLDREIKEIIPFDLGKLIRTPDALNMPEEVRYDLNVVLKG